MLDMPQVEFHYYKNFLVLSLFKKVKDLFFLQRNQRIN